MIKKVFLLLALIIAPIAYGMEEVRKERQLQELAAIVELHRPLNAERNLCFLSVSENPEAATAIAAQIQANQIQLAETTNPKEKAKLNDDRKWLSWLEKVAKK